MPSLKNELTGVVVTYNTHKILLKAVTSIREKYPDFKIIVIDNSENGNETIRVKGCEIIKTYVNIGHGRGMDLGIKSASTPKVLFFDSDIVMIRNGALEQMINLVTSNVYGVGQIIKVNANGQNNKSIPEEDKTVNYLHPHFMVVDREKYFKAPPFIHHGAPCLQTMMSMPKDYKLVSFPIKQFVHHVGRVTRKLKPKEFDSKHWDKI